MQPAHLKQRYACTKPASTKEHTPPFSFFPRDSDVPAEESSAWYGFLSLFGQLPFRVQTTSSPGVFESAIAKIPGGRVYSLRFHKGFLVFAFRRLTDGRS
jgi:hypothetical protein